MTITATKTGLRVAVPYELSPAKAMKHYERMLNHNHFGKCTVHNVVRLDGGDVVTFTRRYLSCTNIPQFEQRVAFYTKDTAFCKWDMIA